MSIPSEFHQQLVQLARMMLIHDWNYQRHHDSGHWLRDQARSDYIVKSSKDLTNAGFGELVQVIWLQHGPDA